MRIFLDPQRPEAVKERENSGLGQWPIAVAENLSALDPLIERLDGASQEMTPFQPATLCDTFIAGGDPNGTAVKQKTALRRKR